MIVCISQIVQWFPFVSPINDGLQIERAVYRSFVAGEFACVGESLQSLPPELSNTLTMQMGLTQLYLPRNHMSRFEAYGPPEARHLSAKHMMHVKVRACKMKED